MIEAIFHGHAFVEISMEQGSILIDPFITGNRLCDVTVDDIGKKNILAICLTHGHGDHVGDTCEIATQIGCPVIAMVELCQWLKQKGIQTCIDMNIGGSYQADAGRKVRFVRADHSSSTPDGAYAGLAAGLLIQCGDKKIYHAGDTGLFADMSSFEKYHLDLAFLPIGDRYTMGGEDALAAAALIKAKIIVPIHFDTFPVIKADAQGFAREILANNCGVPKVLTPGQAVILQ